MEVARRVTGTMLSKYVGQNVCVVGELVSQSGASVTLRSAVRSFGHDVGWDVCGARLNRSVATGRFRGRRDNVERE